MPRQDEEGTGIFCVVNNATDTIEFQFPDGSNGEISFEAAERSSVLKNAMDTSRDPEADSFELPDELDCNDVQAWVGLASSNSSGMDAAEIAMNVMVADRLGDKLMTRLMCSAMGECMKDDVAEMDESIVQVRKALESMRPQLASRVLRHTQSSLDDHIRVLPDSMHNLAVHAALPSILKEKACALDRETYGLKSATAVLNYFSSLFSKSQVAVNCSPHEEDRSDFRAHVEALANSLNSQTELNITEVPVSDNADDDDLRLTIDGSLKGSHIGDGGATALAQSLKSLGQIEISVIPENALNEAPAVHSKHVHNTVTAIPVHAGSARNYVPPSAIKGVKWKQYSDDNFLEKVVDWWLARPEETDHLQVMNAVSQKANSIVIPVDVERRFREPIASNHFKAMSEIVRAIKAGKDNSVPIKIYLWGRVWLERHGKPNRTNIDGGAQLVKDLFTPVLTKARKAQVLDHIAGIILVETNTCKIESSKGYAPVIVDKFNEEAAWNDSDGNPFFKSRTFILPGAGFGLDYRNVGTDQGAFLKEMEDRCGHFAFLYKYMHAAHDVTCNDYEDVDCNGTLRSWIPDMSKNAGSFSVEDRKQYLNFFGLSELTNYVEMFKDNYPNATNIVFWGDAWDGISKTPPRSRQAVQEILASFSKRTGYFFNMAAFVTANKSAQKFYLLDDSLTPNPTPGWSGKKTTAEEWEEWCAF